MQDDEDTVESRSSWLAHAHTRKRALAQKKEVERIAGQLHMLAMASTDANVRHAAVQLQDALAIQKVFEGKDQ